MSYHPKYRPDIDGLRALAVLSVVIFHFFPNQFPGGFIGVDVFFVISGFLISSILFLNLEQDTFSFSSFYARRIKRIFPALFIMLLGCYLSGWFFLLADEYKQLGKHIAAGAGFISNIVLWKDAGYFDNSAEAKPLLHLWSLGIEEQFYMFWPLILWAAWKRRLSVPILTIFIVIGSFAFSLYEIKIDPVGAFYSPLSRIWELLCGSLLAWFALQDRWVLQKTIRNALSCLGPCLLIIGFFKIDKTITFPGFYALLPVCGAICIIVSGQFAWFNRIVFSNRVAVGIGLISYPLYLFHWPILSFLRVVTGHTPSWEIRCLAICASFVLSWITYRFVEQNFRGSKNNKFYISLLVTLMVIIAGVGITTDQSDGFSFRLPRLEHNMAQLSYVFPESSICKKIHPLALASCYQSEQKYPASLYLIGDSHMEALAQGFIDAANRGELNYNFTAIGKGGCNPFFNTESVTFEKIPYGCVSIINSVLKDAIEDKKAKWVLLIGRHAARFNGSAFGEAEKELFSKPWTYEYANDTLKSHSSQEAFQFGLSETLARLKSSGKKVLFVHQFPELGFDPRSCIRHPEENTNCFITRSEVETRLAPYKKATHEILKNYPDVKEYDPIDLVCGQEVCRAFNKNGDLMYRDDNHMSKIGANILARELLKIIQESDPVSLSPITK